MAAGTSGRTSSPITASSEPSPCVFACGASEAGLPDMLSQPLYQRCGLSSSLAFHYYHGSAPAKGVREALLLGFRC